MVQGEIATHPAEVDVGSEVGTKSNGSELGGVGNGEGLEDSEAASGKSSKLATCLRNSRAAFSCVPAAGG